MESWANASLTGVDACNTVLEVLLFAAAMNLGQGWNTVLTLFGGKEITSAQFLFVSN